MPRGFQRAAAQEILPPNPLVPLAVPKGAETASDGPVVLEEFSIPRMPETDEMNRMPRRPPAEMVEGLPDEIAGPEGEAPYPDFPEGLPASYFSRETEAYRSYRNDVASLTWIPEAEGELGWTSLEKTWFCSRDCEFDLQAGAGIHFLSGPFDIDVPARVYDLVIGYQYRDSVGPVSFDIGASAGVYTDFEGSVREGIRFPAHAVGMIHTPSTDFVFGVDFLDRDDIRILPVAGISFHPLQAPALRMDLVFPRPRMEWTLQPGKRMYVSGELGGGTWDILFPDGTEEVMTYRDYRILIGLEAQSGDGAWSGIEIGYVFDRQLELRDGATESPYGDAFVLRIISSN